MKHENIQLHISEWFAEHESRSPSLAIVEFIKFLTERNYSSFEIETGEFLRTFIGHGADQSNGIPETSMGTSAFSSCLKKGGYLVFADIESTSTVSSSQNYALELDIFSPDNASLSMIRESLIEDVMKCFGLTNSKESLLHRQAKSEFSRSRSLLTPTPPISDELFQQLKETEDRNILRELKKRGAVLERDFHDLETSIKIAPDRIRRVLDYFSGEEFQLVERKFAIVCSETKEMIFLLRAKDQIESTAPLQCPKCSRPIQDETLMPYYAVTDSLKTLLDGNRWMPLLVRDSLAKAGVPHEDILTEVKHSDDEIDVLAFFRDRILVIELKNRPVNLNDAYKLSAKTSRLESVFSIERNFLSEFYGSQTWESEETRMKHSLTILREEQPHALTAPGSFVPVVITTDDVARDAVNLLTETRRTAKFLEHCEGKIQEFIQDIIETIERGDALNRFKDLVFAKSDSIGRLTSRQVGVAFQLWYAQRLGLIDANKRDNNIE